MAVPPCRKCGGKSVVFLPYARQDLCGDCFAGQFEGRVRKANYDFHLLRRGDKIAVGVSGGKDSACLLHTLKLQADDIGGIMLYPVLIDEGIDGYRSKAAVKAVELCAQLELPLETRSFRDGFGKPLDSIMADPARTHNSCSYCGVMRRKLLNSAARDLGCNKLAIGHNCDDIAQTFLMNAMRGDVEGFGRFGVAIDAGISGFVPRIKPLVYNLEIECAMYAVLKRLPFYTGSCPYASESFRGTVKDFLNAAEEKTPGVKFSTLHSLIELQKKIPAAGSPTLAACTSCGEPHSGRGAKCKACAMLDGLSQGR